jgi:hypothetical protein
LRKTSIRLLHSVLSARLSEVLVRTVENNIGSVKSRPECFCISESYSVLGLRLFVVCRRRDGVAAITGRDRVFDCRLVCSRCRTCCSELLTKSIAHKLPAITQLGRRPIGRHLGKVLPRFRFDSAEYVGGAATPIFAIPSGDSSRPHGQGGRISWWSTTGFPSTQTTGSRSLRGFSYRAKMSSIRRMYSSSSSATHHIFPATASGRGFPARPEWFPVSPAAPVCVSALLRSAGVLSSASGLPAVDHTPALRCAADAAHPARPLSPAVAARTTPAPSRLADCVG